MHMTLVKSFGDHSGYHILLAMDWEKSSNKLKHKAAKVCRSELHSLSLPWILQVK